MDKKIQILLAIILTALVAGGGVYFFTPKQPATPQLNIVASPSKVLEFNCKQSGGTFFNNKCDCSKVGQNEYESDTGYCLTEIGSPGGQLGEDAKNLEIYKIIQTNNGVVKKQIGQECLSDSVCASGLICIVNNLTEKIGLCAKPCKSATDYGICPSGDGCFLMGGDPRGKNFDRWACVNDNTMTP